MPKGKGYGSKSEKNNMPEKDKKPVSVKDAKKGFGADKAGKSKAKMRHEAQQMQD